MVDEADAFDAVVKVVRLDGKLLNREQVAVTGAHSGVVQCETVFGSEVESVWVRKRCERRLEEGKEGEGAP